MQNIVSIEKYDNIDLSIQLINDISIYAKRVTNVTLHTAGIITTSIEEIPYAQLRKEFSQHQLVSEYMDQIAALVERFGQIMEKALRTENDMIKRKEGLTRFKFFRKLLANWEPLALMVDGWIKGQYQWFLYRIDQVSKCYLNKLIEAIQYEEIEHE